MALGGVRASVARHNSVINEGRVGLKGKMCKNNPVI